jgi:hypothetical protein
MRSRRVTALIAGVLLSVLEVAPVAAEEVPPDWGAPSYEDGSVGLVAHARGRVTGSPGNQHVTIMRSSDEEPIIGVIVDWWCPAGAVAPDDPATETRCREKARRSIGFDAGPGWFVKKWAPDLRWLALRSPVTVTDAAGNVLDRGTVSLRVRGTGATSVVVEEEFREAYLYRAGGVVVGGKLLGLRWSAMTSARVDALWLYRVY